MSARTLSQLLFMAEAASDGDKDTVVIAAREGLEIDHRLLLFLDHLIDPKRHRSNFGRICHRVHEDKGLPHFWRALAAHHHGLVTQSHQWPHNRTAYLARAMGIMSRVEWTMPGQKHVLTPEYTYIYQLRMLTKLRTVGPRNRLGVIIMSASSAIKEGWFEAPGWTQRACEELKEVGRHEAVKALMQTFADRRLLSPCYFSRVQSAELMRTHGHTLSV